MQQQKGGIRQAVLLVILDGYGVNPSRLNMGLLLQERQILIIILANTHTYCD